MWNTHIVRSFRYVSQEHLQQRSVSFGEAAVFVKRDLPESEKDHRNIRPAILIVTLRATILQETIILIADSEQKQTQCCGWPVVKSLVWAVDI